MANSTLKMKNQTPLVTVPSRSLGMKALPKILLALTAVAALSVAYPAKANLITNPGFEQGSNGWTIFPRSRCEWGSKRRFAAFRQFSALYR